MDRQPNKKFRVCLVELRLLQKLLWAVNPVSRAKTPVGGMARPWNPMMEIEVAFSKQGS
jgi:hypothetical protein